MSFLPKNFLDKTFFRNIGLTSNYKDDSKMKFVKFSRDWADEFDVYGFALMTTEEWNEYSEKLKKTPVVSWYFGTNEGYEDESGEDFIRSMEVTDISLEHASVLREVFNLKKYSKFETWGNFPDEPWPYEDEDTVVDEW